MLFDLGNLKINCTEVKLSKNWVKQLDIIFIASQNTHNLGIFINKKILSF